MRRREFITLFAGTLAWAARGGRAATQTTCRRIGVLMNVRDQAVQFIL